MKRLILACMAFAIGLAAGAASPKSTSVYTQRPDDPMAVYFTPEEFGFVNDGKSDVSDALQAAINKVKTEQNFGILFIPEGTYRISRTITIPAAVRVIGYGRNRPVFYLGKNTPGYQGDMNWMFWFTGGMAREGQTPSDANAGTFYSALSNVDFRIDKGNPAAVCIRSHFAQHSFISHCDFYVGDGLAGIYDVGNEAEDLRFFGGQWGINSGRPSPGWPMMLVDAYFEGQKQAAIRTRNVGFAIVGLHVRNVPVVYDMDEDVEDRLTLEKALLENVSDAAVRVGVENNSFSQVNLIDVECNNVPRLVAFKKSGRVAAGLPKAYRVKNYVYGLVFDDLAARGSFRETLDAEPVAKASASLAKDLPVLPDMSQWVNVREFGAVGDGETDDTDAFEKAIASARYIYVPQGWYRLTRTLKMNPGTALIGLHTYATQFIIKESEPAFSGFGTPVPLVESSEGGDDILSGIGVFGGAYNYRAVGVKWMAGEKSYLNDVKFVGGHGTMRRPVPQQAAGQGRPSGNFGRPAARVSSPSSPVYATGKDLAWDTQYWSLWITNGGGGTVKDVWTANTYASAGLYISETSTPGRIYCMSLEHHVRTEARFFKASNWKIYAMQFEEEGTEGPDEHNGEMTDCENITFANLWMYRVIRGKTPKDIGFRIWNSRNVTFLNMHNYTQIVPVIEYPLFDMTKSVAVPAWDFARMTITGDEPSRTPRPAELYEPVRLATGFELAAGAAADSRGNVYFAENFQHKIYSWSAADGALKLVSDHPWKPFSLAFDTKDNLIVSFRYDPQPGYMVNGRQETVERLPDDNPNYSGWGNGGWRALVYAFDPESPDATMTPLQRVPTASVSAVSRWIVPSSRTRSNFDTIVAGMPEYSYVAPDGVTLIPDTYDLGRNMALTGYGSGDTVYVTKEDNKSTLAFKAGNDGRLTVLREVAPVGQYSSAAAPDGTVYVADGNIYVYAPDGSPVTEIVMPERPLSIALGGTDATVLIVTTSRSLYAVRVK